MTLYFNFINGGITPDAIIENLCLQTNAFQYKNQYKKLTKTLLNIFFHRSIIQRFPLQPQNNRYFPESFKFIFVKDTTINSSTAPKSHVNIFTYTKNDNGFNILVSVVFDTGTQLVVIVPKAHGLVTSCKIIKGEPLPEFHLRYLQAIRKFYQ